MIVIKFTLPKHSRDITMKRSSKDTNISNHTIVNGSNKIQASSEELLAAAIATSACKILRSHADNNRYDVDTIEATIKLYTDKNNVIGAIGLSILISGGINQYQKRVLQYVLDTELIYHYLMCTYINITITITNKAKWRNVIQKIINNLN